MWNLFEARGGEERRHGDIRGPGNPFGNVIISLAVVSSCLNKPELR